MKRKLFLKPTAGEKRPAGESETPVATVITSDSCFGNAGYAVTANARLFRGVFFI